MAADAAGIVPIQSQVVLRHYALTAMLRIKWWRNIAKPNHE